MLVSFLPVKHQTANIILKMDEFMPKFRINLSLPPCERYVSLARLYCHRMRSLRGIFDETPPLALTIHPRAPWYTG